MYIIRIFLKKKWNSIATVKKGVFFGIYMVFNYYIIMDSTDYIIYLVREVVFDEETL